MNNRQKHLIEQMSAEVCQVELRDVLQYDLFDAIEPNRPVRMREAQEANEDALLRAA